MATSPTDKRPPAPTCGDDVFVTTGVNTTGRFFPTTWSHPTDNTATTITTNILPGMSALFASSFEKVEGF